MVFWTEKGQLRQADESLDILLNSDCMLRDLALALHMMPTSSAGVERLFSQIGIVKNGRRNRIKDQRLDAEILLQGNSKYFLDKLP